MRLGLLGGTFNPIHIGHLLLAESAREQCGLDAVWFVPTAVPPHKGSRELAAGAHRLAMVRLALRAHASFMASELELRREGVSYTIDTIQGLRERYPRRALLLIVGSDMLDVEWFRMDVLRRLCTFAVARRSTGKGECAAERPGRRSGSSPRRSKIHWLRMPLVDISSSMIRARVQHGQSIRYLVPDAVARYIARHRLYR